MKTMVGVFPSMAEAERVARDLGELGIDRDEISVVAGNTAGQYDEHAKKPVSTGAAAASAASFGGGVGIVASLIALAIPGVGPIIAGGGLATVLTGLGIGAAAGGLIGAFTNMGISHEEAAFYEESVRRGGVVVAAHVNDSMEKDAIRVMDEHGARDLDADVDAWRAAGWKGPHPDEHPYPFDSSIRSLAPEREPVRERQIRSDEMQTATASRTVRSYEYQRPPNQRPESNPSAPASQVSLGVSQSEPTQFPVRRGPVHISNDDPAYVFGNRWASDPNYNGRSWTDVESGLRSNWEAMGTGPWDTFRDRVRRGFEAGSEDPNAPTSPEDKPGSRGF